MLWLWPHCMYVKYIQTYLAFSEIRNKQGLVLLYIIKPVASVKPYYNPSHFQGKESECLDRGVQREGDRRAIKPSSLRSSQRGSVNRWPGISLTSLTTSRKL